MMQWIVRYAFSIGAVVVGASVLGPTRAHAFPELVRHGYTNCTTCHVSPSGGGLLTDYGRGLSAEILSTWGTEKEAWPAHGLFGGGTQEEIGDRWFGVGGDVRAVQYHTDNEFERRGDFVWMQAMLDLGYRIKKWTAVLSIGKFESDDEWRAVSPRYYVLYQADDYNIVRVGRFLLSFGLNIADHTSPTRGTLGFGYYSERDGAEWHYIGDTWNAAIGVSQEPRETSGSKEQGANAQLQRAIGENAKVGASAWYGKTDQLQRGILGVHGAIGFTKKLYLLTELDTQISKPEIGNQTTGYFGYHRLGYEIFKGFHLLGLFEHSQTNAEDEKTVSRKWGGGAQFFPRPHFEISGAWTKAVKKAVSNEEGDYAWLLFHYYL